MKRLLGVLLVIFFVFSLTGCQNEVESSKKRFNVAVEYTDHAAAFYLARGMNLFSNAGLDIDEVKMYASGVGVAAAFARGEFDAGYMCLVPAIYTYVNGEVPIKIIAGTHKDGYGLVVNEAKIKEMKDLERDDVLLANGREGTVTDFLQRVLIEKENLNREKIMQHTVRMNAAKQLMALKSGRVDAVFVPEHFATMAASFPGMKMLFKSQDIWPDMQGSVLVVTEDLYRNHPEIVKKLREINRKSLEFINKNPDKAAEIIAADLNTGEEMVKEEMKTPEAELKVTPGLVRSSLANMRCTEDIKIEEIQAVIDKMYAMGYITKSFDAKEIVAYE
ncbi:ABC transporter substrate-binding protein [Thermosyntropha sp.]|uniref:ABC transporter substrate-binding protein n=1 Tax=Thermosyntropha sp. TaxID=2740820 RepID=UPI0025F37A0C|nr:ABC transporter substrate-binding protein [Thermosyntropha sp.]